LPTFYPSNRINNEHRWGVGILLGNIVELVDQAGNKFNVKIKINSRGIGAKEVGILESAILGDKWRT
jgi:hypothetical protein